ncbi:hypothetical protein BY996DRAFT_6567169 [Phakopsora pachyrhizi]|nr:hypothetical protein BY996DRAFT_6567169 [Phakopsora pachyrhizi]
MEEQTRWVQGLNLQRDRMGLRKDFEDDDFIVGGECKLEPGDMSFDKTSWVAYKDANKVFSNSAHQKIEDSLSKGQEEISLRKLSNGYPIQSAQEDPRETQSKQCLSDNEHKRWDKSYQLCDNVWSIAEDQIFFSQEDKKKKKLTSRP